MERKKARKHDGGGLYIAICCCILVIALIGYANNIAEKNREQERMLAEQAGENVIVQEVITPPPHTPAPTAAPTAEPVRTQSAVEAAEPVVKAQPAEEAAQLATPVGGGVICEFSGKKQVFHPALDDWRTHNGIDLSAAVGDSVAAADDGVVSKVYMDSLGYSICIDHSEGLSTVYSNLDENPTVSLGDNVKKGDVIGHVGTSALGDMTANPHLHFEVIMDGEYCDPVEFLN